MSVRIGYMPGPFPSVSQGRRFFKQLIEVGDRHGYDSIWFSDRVVSDHLALEPTVAMSMVAAYSDRLKFGTAVTQLPLRNPVVLAKEMATLDYLSGGRFLPAVGLGLEDPREYAACGVRKEDRGRRADEAMVVMRRLWSEDGVTHHGEFFTLDNITIEPKPVQAPMMPLWVGGRSRAAARRAGRLGDGWLVSSATPDEVREGAELVFSTAVEHGREVERDHIGTLIGFYIAANDEEAVRVGEPFITRARPDAHFTQYNALGTPEHVVETIKHYLEAGASKFVVRPLCSPDQAIAQLDLLGRKVLPHFHR